MKRTTLAAALVAMVVAIAQAPARAGDQAEKYGKVLLLMQQGPPVRGVLLGGDGEKLQVRVDDQVRQISPSQAKPISYYLALRRTIARDNVDGQLMLLRFCVAHGLEVQVRQLRPRLLRLDPKLKDQIEQIVSAQPSGQQPPPAAGAEQPEGKVDEPARFTKVTQAQIDANHARAAAWAEQAKRSVTDKIHLVETEHFLIYSAWRKSNDDDLARICEKMYEAMCKKFDIPKGQNIWAGKLPIYVFWETAHYKKFVTEVDKAALRSPKLLQAGGYNSQQGAFSYIVLNKAHSKTLFFNLLVHEASHAFLGRYINNRHVPTWANEGIAELMAAQLVPSGTSAKRYGDATRKAIRERIDVSRIFQDVPLDGFWYGIAQSLVRYMIHRDRSGFIQFVKLYKQGKSEADALKEAMGLTHEELLKAWYKSAARGMD
jgi:hypothetical protein